MTTKNKEHDAATMSEKERHEAAKKGGVQGRENKRGFATKTVRDSEDMENQYTSSKNKRDQPCNDEDFSEDE